MQSIQNDRRQIQAAQQAAQQAAANAAAACNVPGQGQQPGQGQIAASSGQGSGIGNAPQAPGASGQFNETPFTLTQEHAPTQTREDGQILASFLVKDPQGMTGESRQRLRQVLQSAESQATDEVETERVSRQSRQAVRNYFGSLEAEEALDD